MTNLIFKLEQKPCGYGEVFSPDCKVEVKNIFGPVYLNYKRDKIIGYFDNMRVEGNELVLADIGLYDKVENPDFGADGSILNKNSKGEVTHILIFGVSLISR